MCTHSDVSLFAVGFLTLSFGRYDGNSDSEMTL